MVLLMCICILCFIFGDKGLTNADHNIVLQVTTSDKCVDGSYRMVNNRDFYLLCYYNHTMDALETALFRRGSDLILSHPGNLTSLFADRGEQSITDYVATVQIKANFSSGDVSNYSCAAGVNSIVPSFPSIVDPTSNSVASVDEAVIRGLIKNAESETIFNEPYTKTVTAETGTGDYYCLPPTLSVEDESGSVCTETRTSTKSTCEFEVTCPPEGLKSYTAFATLYGVSTNKTFHMTCGAPSTPSTRAANTINSESANITETPTINLSTTDSSTTAEASSVVGSTSTETVTTTGDEASGTIADADETSSSTRAEFDEMSASILPDRLDSTSFSASSEATSYSSPDSSSTSTATSISTPVTPDTSTTASKSEKSTYVFYIAVPIGFIIMATVIGVTCYVVHSSRATTPGTPGAPLYHVGDYYNGGHQDSLDQPMTPYGQYEYINRASMHYNPVLQNGDLHRTRGSTSSRQWYWGKSMIHYGRSLTPRVSYNQSNFNQMPKMSSYWMTPSGKNYVIR